VSLKEVKDPKRLKEEKKHGGFGGQVRPGVELGTSAACQGAKEGGKGAEVRGKTLW